MNPHRFARLFFPALFLVSMLFIAQSARSATWTLGAPEQFDTGIQAGAATYVDLNGDGKYDLAVTDTVNDKVVAFLNSPPVLHSWSLERVSSSAVGTGPLTIGACGVLVGSYYDIITANYNVSGSLSFLSGNGDGTFASGPVIDLGVGFSPVSAGEVYLGNGADIFSAVNDTNTGKSYLYTYQLNGNTPALLGTYSIGQCTVDDCASSSPWSFDTDSYPDMAVLYHYTDNTGTRYEFAMLRSVGNGQFSLTNTYELPSKGSKLAAGPFNADNMLDIAVLSKDAGKVYIYNSTGDGLAQSVVLDTPVAPTDILWVNSALVVASGGTTVSAYMSKGDGTFKTRQDYFVPGGAVWLAPGELVDLNGDYIPDIITGDPANTNFSVLPGNLKYDLTVTPSNGGWVQVAEAGPFEAGDEVQIKADPWDGWKFAGWTGPVADANAASTTVTMNSDTTVTPLFTRNSIYLWLTQDGPVVHLRAEYYKNDSPAQDGTGLKLNWRYKLNETDPWPAAWSMKSLGKTIGGTVSKSLKAKAGYYQFRAICAPKGQQAVYGENILDCKVLLQPVGITSGPDDKAITLDSAPAISWQAYDGATGYLVQTSMKKKFKAETVKDSVYYDSSSTSGTIPGLVPGIKTYWRVVAILSDGISTSVGSTPRQITYAPAP